MNVKDYKDFGYMNGWGEYPKEVQKCYDEKHQRDTVHKGAYGTDHDVICHTCEIMWHYDSSD